MTLNELTDDIVKRLLAYTPEYSQIMKMAQRDLGKEIIDRIDEFLKERQKEIPKEIEKIVFEDPSKVTDNDINSIMDAFIKIRSQSELDKLDNQSIDDVLILFNNWIRMGHTNTEVELPKDLFARVESSSSGSKQSNIEDQIQELQRITPTPEMYQSQTAILPPGQDFYSASKDQLYVRQIGEFIAHEERENEYTSNRAVYKSH